MAEEIFGDVPLNVVVGDLRVLVEQDIKEMNRLIYGKYVMCVFMLLHGVITKSLFETITLLCGTYLCIYFFTCIEIKYGNRRRNDMSIAVLTFRSLKYPVDTAYLILLYRILVNAGHYIIEDYNEEERITILIDMSRKLFWVQQTSSLAPDFIRHG